MQSERTVVSGDAMVVHVPEEAGRVETKGKKGTTVHFVQRGLKTQKVPDQRGRVESCQGAS